MSEDTLQDRMEDDAQDQQSAPPTRSFSEALERLVSIYQDQYGVSDNEIVMDLQERMDAIEENADDGE